MSYTVTWTPEARARLADIWLEGPNRDRISKAAHQIDEILRASGTAQAAFLHEGLWAIQIVPLSVVFSVSEPDRMIEVSFVRQV